jgi:hypothetical protein
MLAFLAERAVSLFGVNACGISPVPLHPQESRNLLQTLRKEPKLNGKQSFILDFII